MNTQVQTIEREEQQLPATSESAAILQVIERAATNPNVDIDKMERLFAMRERMLEREAKSAFDSALAAVKADVPIVIRNKYNKQTQSDYADLAAISQAVDPILAKHGFSLSFGADKSALDNHYGITADLTHEAGYSRQYRADVPASTVGIKGNAMMTPIHGFGSAMTYGRRYLKCLIVDISTGDDDDGNAAADRTGPVTEEQLTALRDLIDKTGAEIDKFCHVFGIDALPNLPAKRFDEAVQRLNEYGRKRQQQGAQ